MAVDPSASYTERVRALVSSILCIIYKGKHINRHVNGNMTLLGTSKIGRRTVMTHLVLLYVMYRMHYHFIVSILLSTSQFLSAYFYFVF
jgi:hypothetical protein